MAVDPNQDGHALVARTLKALGATHVYSIPGTPIRETLSQCVRQGLRVIGTRHQQAAVLMSLAQNYVAGRLTSVAILSAGPAITNAATAILVAKDNCWPVVVMGGRRPLAMRGMGSFQELDGALLYRSITKWSGLIEKESQIPECLEKAFRVAVSGRPGPVYLDLPEDLLTAPVACKEVYPAQVPTVAPADDAAITSAAQLLLQAERPALVIGKGVRWSEPYEELKQLVEQGGVPFITSPMGRGMLPDDHALCFNDARRLLQGKADVVLLVGARLDWTFRFGAEFAPNAKIIQIDIERSEIGINRPAEVGIVADAKEALSRIVNQMMEASRAYGAQDLASWHGMLDAERQAARNKLDALMDSTKLPMSPYRMLEEVRDFLPRDAILILDGSVFMIAGQQVLPSYLPASRFTPANNGCLGVGIPFALGAKLAQPNRPVVSICGDTAFAFSAMEMETAVRHRIPVIVVVVNNGGNMGAFVDRTFFSGQEERVGRFHPDIHFESIMRAFGGYGENIDRPEQLRPALERAAAAGVASCINVQVDPDAPYPET